MSTRTTSKSRNKCTLFLNLLLSLLAGGLLGRLYHHRQTNSCAPKEIGVNKTPPLPKQLIVVFGLESSGTTFVYQTICKAFRLTRRQGMQERFSTDGFVRAQHLSLPTGYFRPGGRAAVLSSQNNTTSLPVIPWFPPAPCAARDYYLEQTPQKRLHRSPRKAPAECQEVFGLEHLVPMPAPRVLVNVTSHIRYYQSLGVEVYPVLVVRDKTLHFHGILQQHVGTASAALQEYDQARAMILETMRVYRNDPSITPRLYVISYETLMTLQNPYLQRLYDAIGVMDTGYQPKYRNGNVKIVKSSPPFLQQRLFYDDGQETNPQPHPQWKLPEGRV